MPRGSVRKSTAADDDGRVSRLGAGLDVGFDLHGCSSFWGCARRRQSRGGGSGSAAGDDDGRVSGLGPGLDVRLDLHRLNSFREGLVERQMIYNRTE